MANNAANLIDAKLVFGTIDSNNTFSEDSNARIVGDTSGTIKIRALSSEFSGNTTIQGTLSVVGTITGSVSGNATSATKLATARNITVNGDATGSTSFDGTSNKTISLTVQKIRNVSFHTGDSSPSGSTRLNMNGYFYATRVYNAVWNDIADYIEVEADTPIEYGRVYIKDKDGHRIATKYAQKGSLGIASDTLGFGVGQKEKDVPQIPIAIGGFVLAYCVNEYESGTPLVSATRGVLQKANLFVRVFHPERIIATYYKPERSRTWNKIVVDGRHWVKVR